MDIKKKKVLVTGADGFIGSHLTEALLGEASSVRAFVYYNSFNSWGWLDTFPKNTLDSIEVIPGDVRDRNCVKKAVEGVDVIFHLAALIAIPYSYDAPESYVDTNINGTLNILQSAREFECQKVLVTSTSEVYGTAKYVPIDEAHPLQGQSPYSATKIGADRLAESFHRSFNLPITIVRPFNTYGPRQSARAVIPAIIIQLLDGQTEINLGHTHPTRDFVYVRDTVNGFLAIARSDKVTGEEVNIATQQEHSIKSVAESLAGLINPSARIASEDIRQRPETSEVDRLLGSKDKIRTLTDWAPGYTIEKGLEETVEWFRSPENRSRYKPDIYNW